MPFTDCSFDSILCIDAFEHFPDQETAASEFYRVLRPDGFVFLSVPNYSNVAGLVKWFMERFGGYQPDTWAPFRAWEKQQLEKFMTPNKIGRIFEKANFKKMRYTPLEREWIQGIFPWIEHSKFPEQLKYRGLAIAHKLDKIACAILPSISLHHFWVMEK